jgi:beta-lactamase superfamily II metal-dependent hydrolase
MRRTALLLGTAFLFLPALSAGAQTQRTTLDIYVVDVEGGNATLFVNPAGQSLLIDTGNLNGAVRDAERIVAAARDAGLTRIDRLITTHWHADHYGGMEELAKRIPIGEYMDHGPNQQPAEAADRFLADVYPRLVASAKRTMLKAGDKIPMQAMDITVVTSNGETIQGRPLRQAGAGRANPACAGFVAGQNNIEDPLSVGIHVSFGRFRTLHVGDITKNKERDLMCPNNPIGTIDVFLGLHHGQATSNSPVIVHALQPRVGIMNNGTRKGGEPETMMTLFSSPGFEDLWQIHFSQLSGQDFTQPGMFIANLTDEPLAAMPVQPVLAAALGPNPPPPPVHNGPAYWIKVSARSDGTYTITNQRNGFSKTYEPR